jgi:hypothetical protein
LRRGHHAPTRRLLLGRELRRRRHVTAERDEARDLVLGQRRYFHFPRHRLLDERRKFFLFALDPRFLARVKFGQHFARERFERLADMIVPVLTALLDKGDLIDARILEALEMRVLARPS